MSKNPISAENQQERLDRKWLVGFTDGEGCFSISIFKNETMKAGYQVFPEFVLTQGAKSLDVLTKVQNFFECGNIYENKRYDNHRESLYRYCVRNKIDLIEKICPFFDKNPLMTAKKNDFALFEQGLEIIISGKHLEKSGFDKLRQIASEMNRQKPRNLESSQTKTPESSQDDKIESVLYSDVEVITEVITLKNE